ncbi:VPS10 domain-containing receptor SorCS3-like [Salvelinus fontinalis]|uniref:VPS10 domain-containing receptor SorCS3-like n=1 Tax=Salvelinus fontinalis TaxID=8038 RepID=UPI00248640EC|nr:VPS10 domain-containing receptor SorCS3-like [Salvelinus fontinalis]
MVLTGPEFESSVLISSDEGASYQKYRLSFYILSLLFHPTQEDWALAYSHDQKVYASLDFGRKWQLVHEHVNRFEWSVCGTHGGTPLLDRLNEDSDNIELAGFSMHRQNRDATSG